jgi:UDP-N-acetylmuramoyl-L-alanyl-D-glutamate--2,6-diaminopimelate ligase
MHLSELLNALPAELRGTDRGPSTVDCETEIRGIAYDSRRVEPGDLFFALRGESADGHDHLAAAFERGAVAAIVESVPTDLGLVDPPVVVVRDSRRALAPISTHFFRNPSSELSLIGITGTNGKTSTTYLVESILQRAGAQCGITASSARSWRSLPTVWLSIAFGVVDSRSRR